MRYLLLIILIIKTVISTAQCIVSVNNTGEVITTYNAQYTGKYISAHIQQYGGSPYLGITQWHHGLLILPNNHVQPIKICLNIYNNILSCQMNDSTEIAIEAIDSFYFENRKFIVIKNRKFLLAQPAYYQVVHDGQIKLLKKYRQQLKLTKQNNVLNTKNTFSLDGYFETSEEFYSKYANEAPKFLAPKRKVVYNLLSYEPGAINRSTKNTKMSEQEIIDLFNNYDKSIIKH